ncbi:myristylated IMv envelope protein [Cetacean poxvirus 1]|nr:myristylated IMv envelope protein [Cetacean poxvirus 1]
MGAAASIQTTVNTISENISSKLQQTASASATTECDVTIGNIIFGSNYGCNMTVRNMCSANADAQLEAIMKAVAETYDSLKPEQKAYVPGLLSAALNIQTSVDTAVKDFETYVTQTCKADSVVKNKLKIQNIIINECRAPSGSIMTFNFINTGTSVGNCGIKAIMDVLTKSSTDISPKQSANIGSNIYVIVALVVIVTMLFFYYLKKMLITSTKDKVKIILANKPDVHWTTYLDTFFSQSPSIIERKW